MSIPLWRELRARNHGTVGRTVRAQLRDNVGRRVWKTFVLDDATGLALKWTDGADELSVVSVALDEIFDDAFVRLDRRVDQRGR
ncbi:hypothetical protein IA539_04795 [Gordonia sp. zg691]|uniref:hypothetical protein n=1 Tax=Gordonia jinghuaiqii TaxID=2758710 RepID=UPI00166283DC|nr:hypothetical protein [Gordonia jinghuaiqii]MBD0860525.1 hypothetical protein [Gordonia jinghuaiqii]